MSVICRLVVLAAWTMVWSAWVGCAPAGSGDGWVIGSVFAEDCRDGEPLQQEGDFDLNADFFVGDPLLDSSDSSLVNRSSFVIRIQQTSNRIEQSDSLLLHVHDTAGATRAFAAAEPVPADDCFNLAGCPSGGLVLRAQLNLYNRCPGTKAAFIASNRELAVDTDADRSGCFLARPQATLPPLCPELDEGDRQALLQLCEGDFADRSSLGEIQRVLAPDSVMDSQRSTGNACVFFCQLGDAERGQSDEKLRNFEVDYGDWVAGIFALNLVDPRAVQIDTCATIRGQVYGMFKFKLIRSRAAQAFP